MSTVQIHVADPISSRFSDPPAAEDRGALVLLCAPSLATRQMLERVCADNQMHIIVQADPARLLQYARDIAPDILLVESALRDPGPLELCRRARSTPELARTSIVVVTEKRAEPTWVAAVLRAGVDDYCALEGWSHAELTERLRIQWQNKQCRDLLHDLRLDQERLRLRARTDSLTGALGRAAMAQVLKQRFRARQQYAVIFADLDHFKSVNDRFGHQVGDLVLREVAQALAKACGPQDACGRYGGEEFLLVLGNAGNARALAVAENLREAIRCLNFSGDGGPERVTASFGVAVFNPAGVDESEHAILHRADVALYQAKTEGRDRVVLASPAGSGEMRIPTAAELESERASLVPAIAFANDRSTR